jgi:hypothetical protein
VEVGCATVVTVFVKSVVTAPSDAMSSASDPAVVGNRHRMFGGFVALNVYR